MALFSWNPLTQGEGLSSDPAFLQTITRTTPLEWDSIKDQVLAMFELRDGQLYLPWLRDAADEANDKVRKLKKAAEEAKNAKSSAKVEIDKIDKTDEIDEKRRDKNGHPNERPNECPPERPNGQPSTPAQAKVSSASSASVAQGRGDSSAKTDDGDGETSSASAAQDEGQKQRTEKTVADDDVRTVQGWANGLGWKMPSVSDVHRLLKSHSIEEISDAMQEYEDTLSRNSSDHQYAEYRFFAENGGESLMETARRSR